MNILSLENISKHYGDKVLFSNVTLHVNDADKIGLIGINGTGKSTLLKIIANFEGLDDGQYRLTNNMAIEYLSQDPEYDPESSILEHVFKSNNPIMKLIKDYEYTLNMLTKKDDSKLQSKLIELSESMDNSKAWEVESQVKTVLTKLGIDNFDLKMGNLSGGLRKRVSLACALITPCDLLILDEPTNHMDHLTISWLESYLKQRKGALLMVTHDRYFLDNVVNKTIELDAGTLYTYTGNYSDFLEKKIERKMLESAVESKQQQLYKSELAWIRKGAQARSTKQKARIQRFDDLSDTLSKTQQSANIEISVAHSRLGSKIIECENLNKCYDTNCVVKDFSYILNREDRIGIIGPNGAGKSTLLNLITGKITPDSGVVDLGSTVKIGYFTQESDDMDGQLKAIEYIKLGAEYILTADNVRITASQMMERFLFDKELQWSYISKLSGGERRRLYLLRILMDSPNVLILDEPTNDLDLDTLNVLEDYLTDFSGALITVSHDRYFLNKICNKIFAFEENNEILINTGNFDDYMTKRNLWINENKTSSKLEPNLNTRTKSTAPKFSYNEKLEYEKIYDEIDGLETKISAIDSEILKNAADYMKLQELLSEKEKLEETLLYKLEREDYLSNLEKEIENNKNAK